MGTSARTGSPRQLLSRKLQGNTRTMQWRRGSRSGGGDLTVAVEADVHHGCRGREARLVVEVAAAGGGVEVVARGVGDEIL